MAISVKDIREKEFPMQQTGGYNIEQVDDFLDAIAEQLGELVRENLALTEQVDQLQADAAQNKAKTPDYNEDGYFKNLQNAMRETLIGAQRVADEATANAKAEAERLVNDAVEEAHQTVSEARAEADRMTAEARQTVDDAKAELDQLKQAAESYRANFRKLVEDQLDVLKASDILFK